MSKTRFLLPLLILLAVGYGGYRFAFHDGAPEAQQGATPPPPAVKVMVVKPEDRVLTEEYAGRTLGSREVEVRARVTGILEKRAYTEGSRVQQGDLLFVIDDAPLQAEREQIQARYNAAYKDYQRYQSLWDKRVISARAYEEARATYEQLKAELDRAAINLNYTKVNAPISGVTSKESLSEGSLVTENESLLTRITQLDPIYVNFALPDADRLLQSQIVMPVAKTEVPKTTVDEETAATDADTNATPQLVAEIHFGDGSTYPLQGTVDFTDSIIDPQTGTIRARAVFPNPDMALFPGQFVRLSVTGLPLKGMIAVPDKAIMQGPQGPFVYTVDKKGMAAITPVTLGEINGEMRFIEAGLKQGDQVIVEGMIKVRPDTPVTIDTGETEKPADDSKAPAHP